MKFTARDWHRLQLPLFTLGAALIIAALLYTATDPRKLKTQQLLQAQHNALSQARQRYQTSGTEKATIVKYLPGYQQLIQRGFIGEEQRVRWISDLRDINRRYKFFGISYDIGPQQEDKPILALNPGNFRLQRSTMKLSFAMLHEYDLLTLLQVLQANDTNPPFILRDCVISRAPGGVSNTKLGKFIPNLNTVCELDWLTISEPQAGGHS